MDSNDKNWAADYLKTHSATEEITVIASSFEGRLIAKSLNIPYKTYEKEAFEIDKMRISDKSREQSYYWHQLPEMKENAYLEAVRNLKDYPLLIMHQTFHYVINEILQSYEFIKTIIECEKPDKIVVGKRENPFNNDMFIILSCSGGLEREAAKNLSVIKNIEFIEMHTGMKANKSLLISKKISNVLRNPNILLRYLIQNTTLQLFHKKNSTKFAWNKNQNGPKILFFAWGYYYLEQITPVFDALLRHNVRIGLIIVGGTLSKAKEKIFKQKGICVSYKSDWLVENEQNILNEWKEKGKEAFRSVNDSDVLKAYFSDASGSYFAGLVDEAIKMELVGNIPLTVINLIRTENIIKAFEPDLVVSHFTSLPLGSCDVLPARLQGIPTLSLEHGIVTYLSSPYNTFSSQYYAVPGTSFVDAYKQTIKCPEEIIIPVGEMRLEKMKNNMSIREAKQSFNLNPDAPLCIFCLTSNFSSNFSRRHSTFKALEQVINIKEHICDLQIIIRGHHGADYEQIKKYIKSIGTSDVKFQMSLSPLFCEIVQAADVVISHATSAIAESLVCGVPVVYLCALSWPEPSYFNCKAIKIVDNFDSLSEIVKTIIENPMSRDEVRALAQPYFDRNLCGNDSMAVERLSQLMMGLAKTPKAEWKKGFQDWIDRIEASCEFNTGNWNINEIIQQQGESLSGKT